MSDTQKREDSEKALADELAKALRRLLRLHDSGDWVGKYPADAARAAIRKWKEARK